MLVNLKISGINNVFIGINSSRKIPISRCVPGRILLYFAYVRKVKRCSVLFECVTMDTWCRSRSYVTNFSTFQMATEGDNEAPLCDRRQIAAISEVCRVFNDLATLAC